MARNSVIGTKALGDATRFTMLALLAERLRTAANLSRVMELGRPTISHHVFQLCAAGLLVERLFGASADERQTAMGGRAS